MFLGDLDILSFLKTTSILNPKCAQQQGQTKVFSFQMLIIYYLNNSRCLNSSSQNILITGHKIISCVFSNIFQEVLGRIGQLKFISSLISLLNSSRFPKIFFIERERKTYVNKSTSEYKMKLAEALKYLGKHCRTFCLKKSILHNSLKIQPPAFCVNKIGFNSGK